MISLNEIELYTALRRRESNNAVRYTGFLLPIVSDVNEFLQFIKTLFPTFTDHGLQHSLRNLMYISKILGSSNIDKMSDTEIFCLILASLFHDTGMALFTEKDTSAVRSEHHTLASKVIKRYFDEKLTLLENRERIQAAVEFVCYAHDIDIKTLYAMPAFSKKDTIDNNNIHYSLLAVLLRIGDLMDLDGPRSNKFVMSYFESEYTDEAKNHNDRHHLIKRYYYTPDSIEIEADAENVEQYKIWHTWFEYLEADILRANTYLHTYGIHFPPPQTKILKSGGADFDIQELRFEIDDKGGIWSILSQSIYTGEFDFVKELIQNAIDASLFNIYTDSKTPLDSKSPRFWGAGTSCEPILVAFSAADRELIIIDSGNGMDNDSLKNFLFKVTGSGYSEKHHRDFEFPGIAKYGIGFVSCLVNASRIEILTKKQGDLKTHSVSLAADSTAALLQDVDTEMKGTIIRLSLKHEFKYDSIRSYIESTFMYSSVGITCVDFDKLSALATTLSIDAPLNVKTSGLRGYIEDIKEKAGRATKPLLERLVNINQATNDLDELIDWVKENNDFNEKTTDTAAYNIYKKLAKAAAKSLSDTSPPETEDISTGVELNKRNLLAEAHAYLSDLENKRAAIASARLDVTANLRAYAVPCTELPVQPVSFGIGWKYCFVALNHEFHVSDVTCFDKPIDMSNKTGVLFIYNSRADGSREIEYSFITGVFVSNGSVCQRLSKYNRLSYSYKDRDYVDSRPLIVGSNFDFNDDDSIDEFYDDITSVMYDDDDYDADFNKGEKITREYDAVFIKDNKFIVQKNIQLSDYSLLSDAYVDSKDGYPLLDPINHARSLIRDDDMPLKTAELNLAYTDTDSQYFQDGIRVPLAIDKLFLFGFFRIYCNCTADSRFSLNVTRHNVSENRDDVDAWVTSTGRYLQTEILNHFLSSLKALDLDVDLDEWIQSIDSGDSDYFSTAVLRQLKELI